MDALLPQIEVLIRHVDVLTPHCDWLLMFTIKPNWCDYCTVERFDCAFSKAKPRKCCWVDRQELLPYVDELVPFVGDFKPHREMLFASFEQVWSKAVLRAQMIEPERCLLCAPAGSPSALARPASRYTRT